MPGGSSKNGGKAHGLTFGDSSEPPYKPDPRLLSMLLLEWLQNQVHGSRTHLVPNHGNQQREQLEPVGNFYRFTLLQRALFALLLLERSRTWSI